MNTNKENEPTPATNMTAPNPKEARTETLVTAEKVKSPYAKWKDLFKTVKERTGAMGAMQIRGIKSLKEDDEDSDDEDSDEEDEAVDPNTYTQAQVDHIRQIMITKQRKQALDEMEKLVLGDQYGDTMMMFNTSFSYKLLDAFETFRKKYKNARSWPRKLDLLFAFTFAIQKYDVWMHDHEVGWEGPKMTASLARLWGNAFFKEDKEIDIDPEFTRPGLKTFLLNFHKEIASVETYDEPPMEFNVWIGMGFDIDRD